MPRPATKAQLSRRAHYHYLANVVTDLDSHIRHGLTGSRFIPAEWTAIAQKRPEPGKTKITIRVEADVLKFFRLMGVNYQCRMNEVLRAFMHARLAEVVPGAESVVYEPNARETYHALVEELVEKLARRNSRLKRGQPVEDEDVELQFLMRRIGEVQADLNLPPEEQLLPEGFVDRFYGLEEDASEAGAVARGGEAGA